MRILFLRNKDRELVTWLREQGETVCSAAGKIDINYVKRIKPDLIISYGYRYKLPKEIIKYPPRGAINLHISYLPHNRGADPNIWSFLENTPKGVTIHSIDEGIDTGNILLQERVEFGSGRETLESTYNTLQSRIKDLFRRNWLKIRNNDLFPKKQRDGSGTAHFKKDRAKFKELIKTKGWQTPVKELYSGGNANPIMKIHAIIQARVGSTRLYAKVLKKLKGKTVLWHVIQRVKQSTKIKDIIIATTICETDRNIVNEAKKAKVRHFRGSRDDVLARYYLAAKNYGSDIIVRITSDCPLIDPVIIDKCIDAFLAAGNVDYLSNIGRGVQERTYPRGLDVEVLNFKSLERAFREARETFEREHVTPYIYLHPEAFKLKFIKNPVDYSRYRWTLDVPRDWKLIKKIYDRLYKGKHDFYLKDILNLFLKEPGLAKINAGVKQRKLK